MQHTGKHLHLLQRQAHGRTQPAGRWREPLHTLAVTEMSASNIVEATRALHDCCSIKPCMRALGAQAC